MSKKALIILLVCISIPVVICGSLFSKYIGDHDTAKNHEVRIWAMDKKGIVIHSSFINKMKELAQVSVMSMDAQERLIKAVFGDGGRAGNKAAMQWITEQNPQADTKIFDQMGQVVIASRNKFENHWVGQLSACQQYEAWRTGFWTSSFLKMHDFPNKYIKAGDREINVACTPIQSSQTKATYETGIDDGAKF